MNELPIPSTDPTSIFEHFRGSHGTELLVAATCHFGQFDKLSEGPLARGELKEALELRGGSTFKRPARLGYNRLRHHRSSLCRRR